ncbi:MAG: hypothetical protein K0Q71_2128 [Thermomicrobiales bacterium]|jgi:hypothetical protein|nr:hypothetical protein [Thermomicrobiales bacterium]
MMPPTTFAPLFVDAVLAALRAAFREYLHEARCCECGNRRMVVSMAAEAKLLDAARSVIQAYDKARDEQIGTLSRAAAAALNAGSPLIAIWDKARAEITGQRFANADKDPGVAYELGRHDGRSLIATAVEAEREACAKIADRYGAGPIANEIRARSNS